MLKVANPTEAKRRKLAGRKSKNAAKGELGIWKNHSKTWGNLPSWSP
jgi:hypothetical protein